MLQSARGAAETCLPLLPTKGAPPPREREPIVWRRHRASRGWEDEAAEATIHAAASSDLPGTAHQARAAAALRPRDNWAAPLKTRFARIGNPGALSIERARELAEGLRREPAAIAIQGVRLPVSTLGRPRPHMGRKPPECALGCRAPGNLRHYVACPLLPNAVRDPLPARPLFHMCAPESRSNGVALAWRRRPTTEWFMTPHRQMCRRPAAQTKGGVGKPRELAALPLRRRSRFHTKGVSKCRCCCWRPSCSVCR